MPTINLEMMKQLLEEFSEKEVLTTEEIKVIEKEIASLEERVDFCRHRLQSLGADKEKLIAMKERYVSGKFPAPTKARLAEKTDETISSPVIPDSRAPEEVSDSETKTSLTGAALSEKVESPIEPESQTTAETDTNASEKTDIKAKEGKSKKQEDHDTIESGGEPIKSINDALKGLFRK